MALAKATKLRRVQLPIWIDDMKEKIYQSQFCTLIEQKSSEYSGKSCKVFCEDIGTTYDDTLQECSPFIGGTTLGHQTPEYANLRAQYGIVGLREKIEEFNLEGPDGIKAYLAKHRLTLSIADVVDLMYRDFVSRFLKAQGRAEDQYALIFVRDQYLPEGLERACVVSPSLPPLKYRVIHEEDASKPYSSKNAFYTIRERRIPLKPGFSKNPSATANQCSQRPDFVHYINGIPLFFVEVKTEVSGVLNSLKDFSSKVTYDLAPFKVALNHGEDVLVFADMKLLKHNVGKDNSFKWVNYLPEKKNLNGRVYSNMDYLLDELFCQPENMYTYCMYGCSVIHGENVQERYLVNARIQQYYAIKAIFKALKGLKSGTKKPPFNFLFEHAQRSGKTITMKLLTYLIEKQFKSIYNTVFFYVPDLQIKKVICNELGQSGNGNVSVKAIESRIEFDNVLNVLRKEEQQGGVGQRAQFHVYVVNMQKFDPKKNPLVANTPALSVAPIQSTHILNIVDEAHYGQTQDTALLRSSLFPNASYYLFTATPKEAMMSQYFGSGLETRADNSVRFTISNAKACQITVPVFYMTAQKTTAYDKRLMDLASRIESLIRAKTGKDSLQHLASNNGDRDTTEVEEGVKDAMAKQIERELKVELIPEKLKYICEFMDRVRVGLSFTPKAIVYVESVGMAKEYIKYIQSQPGGQNNELKTTQFTYRFGVDHSRLSENAADDDYCGNQNPGIPKPADVSANFEKSREDGVKNDKIIDILFAVDKYQKGFDLPSLLVTFLDVNINEPAVMSQIYTRSATKHPGKTCGYCVDMTFAGEQGNALTYKAALDLYDSADIEGSFLDQNLIAQNKAKIAAALTQICDAIGVQIQNISPELILKGLFDSVVSSGLSREVRQKIFFYESRKIFKALKEVGSPLGFNPMPLGLAEVLKSFTLFEKIYAKKDHEDHSKIEINLDASADKTNVISHKEIVEILEEAKQVLNVAYIKDLIKITFTFGSEDLHNATPLGEKQEKKRTRQLRAEATKEKIEANLQDYEGLLERSSKPLLERIQDILRRISGNRAILSEEAVQEELSKIDAEFELLKAVFQQKISTEHEGNPACFWVFESLMDRLKGKTFTAEEVDSLTPFLRFIAKSLGNDLRSAIAQTKKCDEPFKMAESALETLWNTPTFNARQTSSYFLDYLESLMTDSPDEVDAFRSAGRHGRFNKEFPLYNASVDEFQQFLKEVLYKTISMTY